MSRCAIFLKITSNIARSSVQLRECQTLVRCKVFAVCKVKRRLISTFPGPVTHDVHQICARRQRQAHDLLECRVGNCFANGGRYRHKWISNQLCLAVIGSTRVCRKTNCTASSARMYLLSLDPRVTARVGLFRGVQKNTKQLVWGRCFTPHKMWQHQHVYRHDA